MRSLPYLAIVTVAACEGDPLSPAFPSNYAQTYVEVRDCRPSSEHDLHNIRVLADPTALEPYMTRAMPFPPDAVLLKEEYDFADDDCTQPLVEWTVMRRLDVEAPEMLGWSWQRVDSVRNVIADNDPRCYSCHSECGVLLLDGYEGTCTVP